MTDVVLVHGSTQSAAGFADLVAALEARGHRTFAVDVPSGVATSAAACADLVAARLPGLDRPVVAAHSAGGLLLPALARRLDAAHQVWIAAAVADVRTPRSFVQEVRDDPSVILNETWLGLDPAEDPVIATYFLFHDAGWDALRRALATVVITDLDDIYAEVPTEDPARVPSTYLLPTEDRTLLPSWMARAARERLGVEPVEVPGAGHNFFVAFPELTADLIAPVT